MEKSHAHMAAVGLIVTLFILFGGYLGFQRWSVEKPIEEAVRASRGASLATLKVSPQSVELDVSVQKGFILSPEYRELRERVETAAGNRVIHIRLIDKADRELADAWEEMAFGVNEGIARQEYTRIPDAVGRIAKSKGIRATARMDDRFVYVELSKGDRFLVRVIPLNKPESEVNTSD